MDIYLVQHGQALSAEQDAQRPLSAEGRSAARKVACYVAGPGRRLIDPPLAEVRHSGKLRARQTAEILAEALCPHVTPTPREGMNPNDDPQALCGQLSADRARHGALLLVGHLPYLAHLAGLLLTGDAAKSPVRFVNAALLKLCPAEDGWSVAWYLTPACAGCAP